MGDFNLLVILQMYHYYYYRDVWIEVIVYLMDYVGAGESIMINID